MVKVTFTLDETTVSRLNAVAKRRAIPKSQVIREAVEDFHAKGDRMPEGERLAKLAALRQYVAQPSQRTQADLDRELAEIRRTRRHGGRKHRTE